MSEYEISVAFNATFNEGEAVPFEEYNFTEDADFWQVSED
jgi:hypothetical protein